MRWCAGIVLGSLLLGGFGARDVRVASGDAAADERAFLAALEQAKTHLAAGRAPQGLQTIDAALGRHARRDYAWGKRADLEDLVRRLHFRLTCPPPEPQSVVKGKLRKFVSKSGELELRYEAGGETDFEQENGVLVFPARFRGPYTITIKGASYPATVEGSPYVQVGMEENPKTGERTSWIVYFGVAPYDENGRSVWLPVKILKKVNDDKTTLFEKEISPATSKKPYTCEVSVGAKLISMSLNGAKLATAPKADGVFGYAALDAVGWKEIVVAGQIEPSWIQTKLDAVAAKQRAKFEEGFEVRSKLPGWLYEAPPPPPEDPSAGPAAGSDGAEEPTASPEPELPPQVLLAIAKLLASIEDGDVDAAEQLAEKLREAGAPESIVNVILARVAAERGDSKTALEVLRAIPATDPLPSAVALERARILMDLGRTDEALASLQASAAGPKATVDLFQGAAVIALFAARPDEAKAFVEAAARRGLRSAHLEKVSKAIVRASNGPEFTKAYEFRSANYHVVSDMDPETCKQAAEILEECLTAYKVRVGAVSKAGDRRYKVFLFAGEQGFQRYLADSSVFGRSSHTNAAGVYSGLLKQLLIWSLPTREEMIKTIRHEGFHQYLDRLLPDPPVWFNEGMATYYEEMVKVQGEIRTDRVARDPLRRLDGGPLMPLREYLPIRPKAFYAGARTTYAQGWLLVHMLQHGTPAHRDLFRRFLARLATSSGPDAIREVFPPESLDALDADLEAYRQALNARR